MLFPPLLGPTTRLLPPPPDWPLGNAANQGGGGCPAHLATALLGEIPQPGQVTMSREVIPVYTYMSSITSNVLLHSVQIQDSPIQYWTPGNPRTGRRKCNLCLKGAIPHSQTEISFGENKNVTV
ncbi:hypothetical protein FKM82_003010 [Ascaphus truei]